MLYGAPGSGKTSFAQALAHQLGLDCYAVAQDVKNDNTARTCSAPEFRFGALRLCDERVDREKSLLVVDEAIQNMILRRDPLHDIVKHARETGRLTPLKEAALQKVLQGVTTFEEAAATVVV